MARMGWISDGSWRMDHPPLLIKIIDGESVIGREQREQNPISQNPWLRRPPSRQPTPSRAHPAKVMARECTYAPGPTFWEGSMRRPWRPSRDLGTCGVEYVQKGATPDPSPSYCNTRLLRSNCHLDVASRSFWPGGHCSPSAPGPIGWKEVTTMNAQMIPRNNIPRTGRP